MSSTSCNKNASDPDDPDDQLDNQTREFIDALDHGAFDLNDINADAQDTLHTVEATLQTVGQRNALKQYAKRYDFRETSFDPDYQDGDTARITFRRRVQTDDLTPSRSADPVPVLPDSWSHHRGDGDDVFEHDETDLTISITKRSGRTIKHDDFKYRGLIRRGDGHGEYLTWGGVMTRRGIYAAAAKFAAGCPDGEYDPEDHLPEGVVERERPRWPDVLGYDDANADPHKWTRGDN